MHAPFSPSFVDSAAVKGREGSYTVVTVSVGSVLESWRCSLLAHEWVEPDGRLKAPDSLPQQEQARCREIVACLDRGEALERPVLGIGIFDTVEIGAGRATFLMLASGGMQAIPVHIPRSHMDEFKPFLAEQACAKP